MRLLLSVAVATFLSWSPPAMSAAVRTRTLTLTAPEKRDYTLATVDLGAPPGHLLLTTVGSTHGEYVAAASERDSPRQILILIVNRQPATSIEPELPSVEVRLVTRTSEPAPSVSQQVDVLKYGASGQDCSAVTHYPSSGTRYLWGYKLLPLTKAPGRFDVAETVAHALDQACSDAIDSQFERWVRQEPPLPHP